MTGQGVPFDLDAIEARRCGYTVIDRDGDEQPCDRPVTGWRWYQGCDHEDMLDVACDWHANEGGRRIARAEADLAAAVAERDAAVAEATRARFENERLISAIRSEWMRQTDALKAERDEARREAERHRKITDRAVAIADEIKAERDAALAQVEAVRALCDECVDSVPRALIRRALDAGDGRTGDQE